MFYLVLLQSRHTINYNIALSGSFSMQFMLLDFSIYCDCHDIFLLLWNIRNLEYSNSTQTDVSQLKSSTSLNWLYDGIIKIPKNVTLTFLSLHPHFGGINMPQGRMLL